MRLRSCRLFGGSREREANVWRFRVPVLFGASVLLATVVPIVVVGGVEAANAAPSTLGPCVGDLTGSTFTLTANCDTTDGLQVPNGDTLNGDGHTITAHDASPLDNFIGSVVFGDSMNIENLTIRGTGFRTDCNSGLKGIAFNNTGGSVSNVKVENITQHNGCATTGLGIWVKGQNLPLRVTITNTVVSGYQKSALVAQGPVTVNVSDSTLGPPDSLKGVIAQNGVQYGGIANSVGAGGTITNSTIYGSGFGNAANEGTAVLLYGAKNVTLSNDTITGAGTDLGVAVATDTFDTPNVPSTGITISHNHIERTAPDSPDTFGIGVDADPSNVSVTDVRAAAQVTASADPPTLICNTFSGWKTNIVGATQPVCVTITTTTLPDGTVKVPYSATLTATGGTAPYTWSRISGSLPPGLALAANGKVSGTPIKEGIYDFTVKATDAKGHTATQALTIVISAPPPPPKTQGYWLTAGDGGVFTFGSAAFHGSAGNVPLVAPVVGIATTPNGVGYWLGAKDGGVFSYGVPFHGSLGKVHLTAPIVAIAATPDGQGYYLVGADGGVFTFGDARFHGSLGNVHLAAPIGGIAVTRDGGGYYLVGKDGGVFSFGDARFQGSLGATAVGTSIAGIAVDNATQGYWLVGANGTLYSFEAPTFGSLVNAALHAPVVGITSTQDGLGYRFVASDGGVFCFGNAHFLGSMGGTPLNQPAVGMASVN